MNDVKLTIVRVPAIVPAWLHVAYLKGHLTRSEWLMQTRLYVVWYESALWTR